MRFRNENFLMKFICSLYLISTIIVLPYLINSSHIKHIADTMNKIYVGDNLVTHITSDGLVRMDIFDKTGNGKVNVIKLEDNIKVDSGTLKLKKINKFGNTLFSKLFSLETNRTNAQEILDRFNSRFHDGVV